jgi:pimeloyl-ACP methyl ester carboxylesterase
MAYRTIDNTLMSYHEQGSGKPLVLIHGFPLDWRIFESQVPALAKTHRVIAPDLRGFGQSKSDAPFMIASLADDVHALLQAMNVLPCALGGLSMGGYIALAFAKKYPQDLSSLILMDTRAEPDTAEGKEARNKMIALVHEKGAKAVADQMLPKMLSQKTIDSNPGVASKLRQIIEGCPPKTIEHALAALRDREDYSETLPKIAVATLIIVGEEDAITPPKMAQTLNQNIRQSKLVQIPGAGHLSTMEKPDEVTAAIKEFISNQPN